MSSFESINQSEYFSNETKLNYAFELTKLSILEGKFLGKNRNEVKTTDTALDVAIVFKSFYDMLEHGEPIDPMQYKRFFDSKNF